MKKYLLAGLGLLLVQNVSAAGTWYFDSNCATPGDGTTSVCSGATAPFDQLSDRTIAAGDTLVLKGTFNEQLTITNLANVTVKVNGYTIIDGQNSRSYAISADRATNLRVSGYLNGVRGQLELRNATRNGFYGYTVTAANTTRNIKLEGAYVHDIGPGLRSPANENDLEIGTCILARGTDTSVGTAVLDGVQIHDNIVENCGKHGIDIRYRVLNFTITKNRCRNAGLTATGHCISTHPFNQSSWSPSWTLASGTTYYRDLLSVNDTHQRMVVYTTGAILNKVASTATPASGEWSVTSAGTGACTLAASQGCIYVNTGANPNSQTVVMKRHLHGPFKILANDTAESQSGVDTAEGHGIDADDLSGPGVIARNWSHDNYGTGIQIFYGENLSIFGNVSNNNGAQGILTYSCTNCLVDRNTVVANDDLGIYGGGTLTPGLKVRNNIMAYNAIRGGSVTAGTAADAGFVSSNNLTFGNVANNACTNLTCTASDPGMRSDALTGTAIERFCVSETGAAWGTGVAIAGTTDYFGASDTPPNIGAMGKACGRASFR